MNLINFKILNAKQKNFIGLTAFLGLASTIFYFIILPTINDIKTLKADITAEKVNMEIKINRGKNMSKLSEKVKKIEPQMEKFSQIFINQTRELEFITSLEGIAKNNRVIQELDLKAPKEKNDILRGAE